VFLLDDGSAGMMNEWMNEWMNKPEEWREKKKSFEFVSSERANQEEEEEEEEEEEDQQQRYCISV